MWQSVTRRVYQQISNKDVDIRGETLLHATTKRTSPSKSLKFIYSSRHMKHKIIPPSLLLKLLYNLPHQHNFSTSMGQNLSSTFSVPPWLYSAKSNRKRCFLYFSVSSGYKSRRLTRILWSERRHNYRYTWPEKVVTEAIDHQMLNLINKRLAIASQQTNVYVALLL